MATGIRINDSSIIYIQCDKIVEKWVIRFLECYLELALIMPKQINAFRVKESSHKVFQIWFTNLKLLIDKYNI
jgi:hypothetical protein